MPPTDARSENVSAGTDLWNLLQRTREPVQRVMLERAARIPALAPLMGQMGSPEALVREARSQELTRRALVDGEWQPYLDDIRAQGRVFARMGITLSDWYSLIDAYRTVLVPAVVEEYQHQPSRLIGALLGVDTFVDRAMRELGTAFVDESALLVRVAEGERALYAKLFEASPLGLTIWRRGADGAFEEVTSNPTIDQMRLMARVSASRRAELRAGLFERAGQALITGRPVEWSFNPEPTTSMQVWLVKLDEDHVGQIVEETTAIRRATRQLQRSISELERSNRDLDEFAYVASHDLKAPLRDIDNLSRWLVEDLGPSLPEASSHHMVKLRDRVVRMEHLLDDLLEYSRAGRVTGPAQRFDLVDAVASASTMVGTRPGFTIVASSGSLVVHTPRAPFELVLRNLLGNAIKHHDRESGQVVLTWAARESLVEVTVLDDGPGIPPAFHDRVFAMFQTLQPRDRVEGSGMGLAIVRKVVEAFGGTVGVRSDGERGTAMIFTWPLDRIDSEEASP